MRTDQMQHVKISLRDLLLEYPFIQAFVRTTQKRDDAEEESAPSERLAAEERIE